MANEQLRLSAAGLARLREREHVEQRYYNDLANNCTWGIGTLAHHGPCTDEEIRSVVTIAQIEAELSRRVLSVEAVVRLHVRERSLTQEQFDALVSYTYNAGSTGARTALHAANAGRDGDVVLEMRARTFVHPRNARGQRLIPRRVHGLVVRREEEARPFLPEHPEAR